MGKLERILYTFFCGTIGTIICAFALFIFMVMVNAYKLDKICTDAGGVSVRGRCLQKEAIIYGEKK